MLRSFVIGAAAVLTAGTMLTAAAGPVAARTAPAPKVEADAKLHGAADDGQRVCINRSVTGEAMVTGSILSRRQCRTRADWAARGVDLSAARR